MTTAASRRWYFPATDVACASLLALITVLVAWRAAPLGFNEGFVDMAHDGYQLREALDLRNGGMLFRDTFEQYGPLGPYLNLVGFLAFGQTLLAIKHFVALWYGLTAIALYVLSRRLLNPVLACFSILAWIALAPFYQHGVMLSPHAYVIVFQAAAILILSDPREPSSARLTLAGALCGACWLLKQPLGTLFLLGAMSAVMVAAAVERDDVRRAALRAAWLITGFAAVLAAALAWLAANGAISDWYLQTIAFPRTFYLEYFSGTAREGAFTSFFVFLRKFFALQLTVQWYWPVLHVLVIAGAGAALVYRKHERVLALIGMTTAWLWLAAFPSVSFMHQWWTLSLSFGALVYVVRWLVDAAAHRASARQWLLDGLAMAMLTALVSPAIVSRIVDARARRLELSETITAPQVMRGLRTTPSMKRGFERLMSEMTAYRLQHPNTAIVSIDAGDGATTGIAESLPLLSWFDDNTHPFPIYWNLPVLSTITYPDYYGKLLAFVRNNRPLVVDAVPHGWTRHPVSGYVPLVTVPTERGELIVYVPERADATPVEKFAFGDMRPPKAPRRRPQFAHIVLDGREVQAAVYAWPDSPDIRLRVDDSSIPLDLDHAAYVGPEFRRDGRALVVDGQSSGQYTYVLKLEERFLKKGERFSAIGTVTEGGLSIGLLANDRWRGYLNVARTGPFLAVVEAPADGTYSLVIANNIDRPFVGRVRSIGWKRALIEWWRKSLPNRFRISRSGWSQDADEDRIQ